MQPHEFKAFVDAIVSAKTACLIDQKTAASAIENQVARFLPQSLIAAANPDFRDAMLNAGQRG